MADPATTAASGAGSSELDLERGSRGRLLVKDKAVSRIAVAAALSVPGVARQSSGLLRLPGRELPRAEVTMGPESVAVTLYLAVRWPCPVAVLSRDVHITVAERVETLTGLPLEGLHIVVAAAVPRDPDSEADVDSRQLDGDIAVRADPPPARTPLARPAAAPVAVAVAVVLIGVAVVAAREFLIAQEAIAPAAWVRNSLWWIAGLHWQTWMAAAGIAAAVLGVVLVGLALLPRTRTHVAVGTDGPTIVWVRPVDVARMCSARAGAVAGVGAVQTTVDGRHATVHVTPDGDVGADELSGYVRDAVAPALDVLSSPRILRIRVGKVRS